MGLTHSFRFFHLVSLFLLLALFICVQFYCLGPIETITRVKLDLYPGLTGTKESIGFDGETLILEDSSQFDPTKPIKVVIHGWHGAALNDDGEVVDNKGYPWSFNQLYQSNGLDFTVLGVHWVPIGGWNNELQTSSSSDAGNTIGLLIKAFSR